MYELLIKGGMLIDPVQEIHDRRDIGVSQGKIVALNHDIAPSKAERVIDTKGKIVTPGLIDIHVHVADVITPIGVVPDEAGVLSGVTTLCDAGSTGYANFPGFQKFVIPQARTDVFCFLHVIPVGLATIPELWGSYAIDPEATLKVIENNRNVIRGVKLRATGAAIEEAGFEMVRVAKRIATDAGLPLVVHIGIDPWEKTPKETVGAFTRELLDLLDKGDILAHVFTPKIGGVIQADGTVAPELKEAMKRGVVLDVANAASNFRFEVARKGLEQGILPTTLSTDLTTTTFNRRAVLSLLVTMSKFLALGLSLHQVIQMTTINPARALNEEHRRGSLRIGMPADISILELVEGDFLFFDSLEENTSLKGTHLLIPKLTLKSGVEIEAYSRFK